MSTIPIKQKEISPFRIEEAKQLLKRELFNILPCSWEKADAVIDDAFVLLEKKGRTTSAKMYNINTIKATPGVGIRRIKVGEVKSREDAPGYFKDRGYKIVAFELDPDGNDAADIAVMLGGIVDCYSIDKQI